MCAAEQQPHRRRGRESDSTYSHAEFRLEGSVPGEIRFRRLCVLSLQSVLSCFRALGVMCALQNSNHIGVDGAEAIAQALTQNSTVKSLLLVRFVFGVVFVCRC